MSRLIILIAFALALAGGVTAGMLASRMSARPSAGSSPSDSSLAGQLQLTVDQQRQIRAIWEHVQQIAADSTEEAARLDRVRENKLLELLTDEQKKRYQPIYQEYQDGYTALMARREKIMSEAIEQTRQLLNESQRQKYDLILAQRKGRNPGTEHGIMAPLKPPATEPAAGGAISLLPGE